MASQTVSDSAAMGVEVIQAEATPLQAKDEGGSRRGLLRVDLVRESRGGVGPSPSSRNTKKVEFLVHFRLFSIFPGLPRQQKEGEEERREGGRGQRRILRVKGYVGKGRRRISSLSSGKFSQGFLGLRREREERRKYVCDKEEDRSRSFWLHVFWNFFAVRGEKKVCSILVVKAAFRFFVLFATFFKKSIILSCHVSAC